MAVSKPTENWRSQRPGGCPLVHRLGKRVGKRRDAASTLFHSLFGVQPPRWTATIDYSPV